jgi:type IV pilus assembly protein PilW
MSTRPFISVRRGRGFSLVELMVAMLLGLILIAGMVEIFTTSRFTYQVQDGLARVQENGRFALDVMKRDIRLAGYVGCSRLSLDQMTDINNTLQSTPPDFNHMNGLQGWEADNTAPTEATQGAPYALDPTGLAVAQVDGNAATVAAAAGWGTGGVGAAGLDTSVSALPGSDVIRVWRLAGAGLQITNIPGAGAGTVVDTVANTIIQDDDILLLTDCLSGDWVQACSIQTIGGGALRLTLSNGCTPGNIPSLPLTVGVGANVFKLQSHVYFVGKRGGATANPPALFRAPLDNDGTLGAAEELIEGVESMQITYGEDTDGDLQADRYVVADAVVDWQEVTSVRLGLLLASVDEPGAFTDDTTYNVNGSWFDPADDRRLRKVFSTTIALRNRVP